MVASYMAGGPCVPFSALTPGASFLPTQTLAGSGNDSRNSQCGRPGLSTQLWLAQLQATALQPCGGEPVDGGLSPIPFPSPPSASLLGHSRVEAHVQPRKAFRKAAVAQAGSWRR